MRGLKNASFSYNQSKQRIASLQRCVDRNEDGKPTGDIIQYSTSTVRGLKLRSQYDCMQPPKVAPLQVCVLKSIY